MHFSIIVAGDNYEEQLAPFQENNMGDCPNEYLEFYVDGECYATKEEAERKPLGSKRKRCSLSVLVEIGQALSYPWPYRTSAV